MHVNSVSLHQIFEDVFLLIHITLAPSQGSHIGIPRIPLLVMNFTLYLAEERGDERDGSIQCLLQLIGVPAELDRRQIHHQIAADNVASHLSPGIVNHAFPGRFDPATEASDAGSDVEFTQPQRGHTPIPIKKPRLCQFERLIRHRIFTNPAI